MQQIIIIITKILLAQTGQGGGEPPQSLDSTNKGSLPVKKTVVIQG